MPPTTAPELAAPSVIALQMRPVTAERQHLKPYATVGCRDRQAGAHGAVRAYWTGFALVRCTA